MKRFTDDDARFQRRWNADFHARHERALSLIRPWIGETGAVLQTPWGILVITVKVGKK